MQTQDKTVRCASSLPLKCYSERHSCRVSRTARVRCVFHDKYHDNCARGLFYNGKFGPVYVYNGGSVWARYTGEQRLHVLTQAPYPDDRAGLPNGVYITRTYTELEPGSQRVAVVVRNMTSQPIHLAKGKVVARVQAANLVPEATPSPELLKKLGADSPAVDKPQMTVKERQEALLAALKKDGGLDRLKDWPPALAAKAIRLLLEFHYIFSLEPNEIGCTDLTEHS